MVAPRPCEAVGFVLAVAERYNHNPASLIEFSVCSWRSGASRQVYPDHRLRQSKHQHVTSTSGRFRMRFRVRTANFRCLAASGVPFACCPLHSKSSACTAWSRLGINLCVWYTHLVNSNCGTSLFMSSHFQLQGRCVLPQAWIFRLIAAAQMCRTRQATEPSSKASLQVQLISTTLWVLLIQTCASVPVGVWVHSHSQGW